MPYLYLTADQVGLQSGGGRVTQEESTALHDLAVEQGEECRIWGRDELKGDGEDPWKWDIVAWNKLWEASRFRVGCPFRLVHAYAGTFTNTVSALRAQGQGIKIVYTAAAHNVDKSKQEHVKLGLPFDYPHLTNPQLWGRYVGGYRAADVVVCPSQHSAACMRSYGCQRIEVIPHGCDVLQSIPAKTGRISPWMVVGYLGCCSGPDKGLTYLLQAWKKLDLKAGVLALAGRDSTSPWVNELVKHFGGGNICQLGWQENAGDFYRDIDLLVQPSISEGFGLEVLEAMSHGRAVLVSDGAGAADVVPETWRFQAGNVDDLAAKIDQFRKCDLGLLGAVGRGLAAEYSWDKIRVRYQEVWKGLLA